MVLNPAAFRDFRIEGEKRTISINVSSGRLGAGSNIAAAHFFAFSPARPVGTGDFLASNPFSVKRK
jgi:hypothetical protein